MNAFLTGSQVYGVPNADSDVDMCVVMAQGDVNLLRRLSERCDGSNGDSLIFGKLNLLILSEGEFDAWKEATESLKAEKPVTRERAVTVIEQAKGRRYAPEEPAMLTIPPEVAANNVPM